jgi:murein DD-endopeptidase MepM/ murein hydrolase activator NlpD
VRRSRIILLSVLGAAALTIGAGVAALLYSRKRERRDNPKSTDSFDLELEEQSEDFERGLLEFIDEQGFHMRVPLISPPLPLTLPEELGGGVTPVGFWPNSYNRGKYKNGVLSPSTWHRAVDLRARRRTPVLSPRVGVVFEKDLDEDVAGYYVAIRDDIGIEHYMAHLDAPPLVKPGFRVLPGQIVGFVGNSGNAKTTKCHLHYQQKLYRPMKGYARYPNPYAELRVHWPHNTWKHAPASCTKHDGDCAQCLPRMEVET